MKGGSFLKALKNGTLREYIWENKREKLARNEKKQKKLKERYKLYQLFNRDNIYDTNIYQSYYKIKQKYGSILDEGLGEVQPSQKSDKVWICWFQGEENAPELVKACIRSIRKQLSDREVIVLSHETIPQYLSIPNFISEKVGKSISLTHYSDILRVMLLNRYGGLWIDSTVFCTSKNFADYFSTLPLFVYKNVKVITRWDVIPIAAESWLIYSESNQKILLMVEKLLFAYWQREKSLENYFLFHLFFTMATEKYSEDWKNIPTFSEVPPNVMGFEQKEKFCPERWQQFLAMSDFHKLSYKRTCEEDGTFYSYVVNFDRDEK